MPIIIRKKKPAQLIAQNPFPEIPDPLGRGQAAVDYLRSLQHPLSTLPGNAFRLDPWQEKIIRQIYGPRHEDGSRIVKTVYLLIPRGNRKTTLAAALVMLHAKGPEKRAHSQLVSVASDKKQAKLVLSEVSGLIDPDYAFAENIGNSAKTMDMARGAKIRGNTSKIIFPGGIEYEALSSDAGTAQGRTPSLVVADEIHAWAKRDPRALWGAMRAGAAKVANSLTVVTTTAGAGQENLAWELIDYARKVARGDIDDPATLAILYEADKDADWHDEAVWQAVNPGLEYGYPDLESLRQMAREAEHKPAERAIFQRYHLNIWQDQSTSPFVDMLEYDKGKTSLDMDALEGEPCWIGVDMSVTTDLTAVVAAFRDPDHDDGYIVLPHFFCPGDNLQKKADADGVPYPLWADEGFIEPTPGNVIDYRAVGEYIRELCERFQVKEIAFDPAYAQPVMGPLTDEGYPCITMRQGWVTQSPALNTLEAAIIAGRFQHGGHPVLRWNFENVAIHTDSAGNRTMHKGKSKDRIDGAVACWMAVARAAAGEGTEKSIFDDPNVTAADLVW